MESLQLTGAILLSWLLGMVWLQPGRRFASGPGWRTLTLGYGYIIGVCATTLIMRLLDALGFAQNIYVIEAIVGILILTGIAWSVRHKPAPAPGSGSSGGSSGGSAVQLPPLSGWQKMLFGFFLLLIIARLASIGLEVVLRPLYPWDAWTTWAVKPQVWFAYRHLVPFVDAATWINDRETYTIDAWHYPDTVPLIQLWTALAYGQWNEIVNNISWLLCLIALALGFYGQARQYRIDALTAVIFTWLLISIPLLNTHAALAGYADLWMATVFSFAAMAFWHWLKSADPRQGWVALGLGCMLPLIKTEGTIWLLTAAPAIIVYFSSRRILFLLLAFFIVLAMIFMATGSIYFKLPWLGEFNFAADAVDIPFIGSFLLSADANFSGFIENLLLFDNWHLFWYLALLLLIPALPVIMFDRLLVVYGIMIAGGIAVLIVVFSMTGAAEWAVSKTSVNRAFLQLVPLLLFYLLIAYQHWSQHRYKHWRVKPAGTAP